jgi:AcrR family transcriptional regulator
MTTSRATSPAEERDESVPHRDRLVEGLATSIQERGFRETRIADIVRHARTSRRTFYAEFASKEECYVALLDWANEGLVTHIANGVDVTAPWRTQVRQAVDAYVDHVLAYPAITVSWIRELPALGAISRQVQRSALKRITGLIVQLTRGERFRAAGAGPMDEATATLLLGGIRELTAAIIEDDRDVRELTEVVVNAATALLRPVPE